VSRLADHLAGALDPVALARLLRFDPDPTWQCEVLRSQDPRLSLVVHRQGGKSTVAAMIALHRALYWPGSTVLVLSPTLRQSGELFRKVLTNYRRLGKPLPSEAENALSLVLENGSRVIALPGTESNIRGYTADLLVVDEAARVDDSLYGAISPMLAVSGGRLVALSTPWGRRGWFYETTRSSRWRTVTVIASECPRISAAWLAEEHDRIGDFWFRQEYGCEFIDALGQMFSTDDIEAMFQVSDNPVIEASRLLALGSGTASNARDDRNDPTRRPAVLPAAEPEVFAFGKPLPRWAQRMHGGW
jgi:hypothetical protein